MTNNTAINSMANQTKKTKLYEFRQNNSGGIFDINKDVCAYVYIEAPDAHTANNLAEMYAGIYFDGVDNGIDCPCCGDRWYMQDDYDGIETVQEFAETIKIVIEYHDFKKSLFEKNQPDDIVAIAYLLNGIRYYIHPDGSITQERYMNVEK